MSRYDVAGRVGVERSGRALQVAAGDLLVVGLVLTAGLLRHRSAPLAVPEHTVLVMAPFVLGWLVAAPLVGVYAGATLDSRGRMLATTAVAWLATALVGAGLRATALFPGDSPPVFVAVVAGTGLLGLLAWRLVLLTLGVVVD